MNDIPFDILCLIALELPNDISAFARTCKQWNIIKYKVQRKLIIIRAKKSLPIIKKLPQNDNNVTYVHIHNNMISLIVSRLESQAIMWKMMDNYKIIVIFGWTVTICKSYYKSHIECLNKEFKLSNDILAKILTPAQLEDLIKS